MVSVPISVDCSIIHEKNMCTHTQIYIFFLMVQFINLVRGRVHKLDCVCNPVVLKGSAAAFCMLTLLQVKENLKIIMSKINLTLVEYTHPYLFANLIRGS
jgi:hypothetical protein